MGPLQLMSRFGTHAGIAFMRLLAPLPLPLVRWLGAGLGGLLYWVALPRRQWLCHPSWRWVSTVADTTPVCA